MKELGVGIIGSGWVAGSHIQAFEANPHTEVRAIVSRDKARAAARAAELKLAHCRPFDRLAEMLASPDIHIVSIATPHHLHVEQGVAAAQAGKHLILVSILREAAASGSQPLEAIADAIADAARVLSGADGTDLGLETRGTIVCQAWVTTSWRLWLACWRAASICLRSLTSCCSC